MIQSWRKFITIFSILFLLYSCGSSKKQHISEYLKASKVEVLKTKETTTEVQKNIQREEVIRKDITSTEIKADSLVILKPDGTKEKYYGVGKKDKKDNSTKNKTESDRSTEKAKVKEKEDDKTDETTKTKDKTLDKQPDKSFNSTLKWLAICGFLGLIIFIVVKFKKWV